MEQNIKTDTNNLFQKTGRYNDSQTNQRERIGEVEGGEKQADEDKQMEEGGGANLGIQKTTHWVPGTACVPQCVRFAALIGPQIIRTDIYKANLANKPNK